MIRRFSKSAQVLLQRRLWAVAFFQALLVFSSLVLAWLLGLQLQFPPLSVLVVAAPLLVAIRLIAIAHFNLLHGWWRYTGINDAMDVAKAVAVGSVAFFCVAAFIPRTRAIPISIYPLEALVTGTMLAGIRLISRLIAESVLKDANNARIILIGAGHAAQMVLREIKHAGGYVAIGCLDDDPRKRNLKIQGVPVLGPVSKLIPYAERYHVDEVLIAVPSASGRQMKTFVEICEKARVRFRTVPSLSDLISGRANITEIREVNMEDLLGREPTNIDLDSVRTELAEKVVLVTGAAGSIGSELCRQILKYEPGKLLCVDHNETGIFYLQRELSELAGASVVEYLVADIRNAERMTKLFWESHVDIVFHAAAYKHVPVMERNVQEAVTNNVFGLLQLMEIAEEAKCKSFVLISSDKAVNPTSIMGCTKRIGELILAAWPRRYMKCVSVRFGNVLGSSGSVIPLFAEQLRKGQPITITHPEMRRYFMTVREAVSLVLQAAVIGDHGEILVLDMGEPVTIKQLADTLISLAGRDPSTVPICYSGLRPGEKLCEELFYRDEQILPTSFDKIKRTESPIVQWSVILEHLRELQQTIFVDGANPIRRKIKEIIPEYVDPVLSAEHATPQFPRDPNLSVARS